MPVLMLPVLLLSRYRGAKLMPAKLILLIEPEASIREILCTALAEFAGWQVTIASTIQQGLQLCLKACPDVILLDTSSSEADVLIFVEQLKHQSLQQSVPIVLISARASWFTSKQFQQMGFAGAITKPFDPLSLAAQVSHLLDWEQD
jgi:DNA-binding response OmpR family regulator